MISVIKREYCQDCPHFKAKQMTTRNYHTGSSDVWTHLIKCEHFDICVIKENLIREKIKKEYGIEEEQENED